MHSLCSCFQYCKYTKIKRERIFEKYVSFIILNIACTSRRRVHYISFQLSPFSFQLKKSYAFFIIFYEKSHKQPLKLRLTLPLLLQRFLVRCRNLLLRSLLRIYLRRLWLVLTLSHCHRLPVQFVIEKPPLLAKVRYMRLSSAIFSIFLRLFFPLFLHANVIRVWFLSIL